jgi:hypothetical protein
MSSRSGLCRSQATLIARQCAKEKIKDAKRWSAAIRVQAMMARTSCA